MTFDLTGWQTTAVLALILWELIWKGFALWRAAQRHEPYWFAALLVISTAGIFPIIYLLATSPKENVAVEYKLQGV